MKNNIAINFLYTGKYFFQIQCKLIINYVEIIARKLELFKTPIIDFTIKKSAQKKGEINNLTSAIGSAP